jgi:hypothetical protein
MWTEDRAKILAQKTETQHGQNENFHEASRESTGALLERTNPESERQSAGGENIRGTRPEQQTETRAKRTARNHCSTRLVWRKKCHGTEATHIDEGSNINHYKMKYDRRVGLQTRLGQKLWAAIRLHRRLSALAPDREEQTLTATEMLRRLFYRVPKGWWLFNTMIDAMTMVSIWKKFINGVKKG